MKVSVSEPSDLEAVNSILHDHWCDVDRIERRGESLLLPISGTSRSRPRSADFSKMLVVNPVRAVLIDDREKIGYYDLNHIEIHPDRSLLVLEFNIPIRIEITLGGLPVVLEVLDLVA